MTRSIVGALAVLFAGCGGKTIHLDLPVEHGDGGAPGTDGGVPNVSVVVANQDVISSFAVDATRVYWSTENSYDFGGAFVRSCSKADCASSITTYDTRRYDDSAGFGPVAVDGSNVYWLQTNHNYTWDAWIFGCPIDGCGGAPRAMRRATARVTYPSSLVANGGYVYWTAPSETGIFRCAVASCADAVDAVALNQEGLGALAVGATHVYWTTQSGRESSAIMRAPKDGTAPPEIVASEQNLAWALALDAEFVYWTIHYGFGGISRCPLAGCSGSPTVLVSYQDWPAALATDGNALFWINSGSHSNDPLTLLRCFADSCQSTFDVLGHRLLEQQSPLVLDATHVYWLAYGAIERTAR